jgi:hypothetical protein
VKLGYQDGRAVSCRQNDALAIFNPAHGKVNSYDHPSQYYPPVQVENLQVKHLALRVLKKYEYFPELSKFGTCWYRF